MPINNFDRIRPLLNFDDKDLFYFCSVFKRRKDNPDMKGDNKCIRNFYINSINEYELIGEKMIGLCHEHNARAYIRLNRRSYKECALFTMAEIARLISLKTYKIDTVYESICGRYHVEKDNRTWIIDADDISIEHIQAIEHTVKTLMPHPDLAKFIRIPTKNGLHIICKPFHYETFMNKAMGVDVHKDNPTLLFCL